MTNLIKVETDKYGTTIMGSGHWTSKTTGELTSITNIHIFKSAQRVLTGQLSEPILDRLSSSLAPVGDCLIPTQASQLIASSDFWERLIEIQPVVNKFKKSWKTKFGFHIWVDKKYSNVVITLKPLSVEPTVEPTPVEPNVEPTVEAPSESTVETVEPTVKPTEITEYETVEKAVKYKDYAYLKTDNGYKIFDDENNELSAPILKSAIAAKKHIRDLMAAK
jgi:hypothetical protein